MAFEDRSKPHEKDIPNQTTQQSRQPVPESSATWLLTRRKFVATMGAFTGGIAFSSRAAQAEATFTQVRDGGTAQLERPSSLNMVALELKINGEQHKFSLDPRVTLLDLLREELALTGTKKGCDHGQCGACTVLADGRRINSCLSLAVTHQGQEITTIEGIAKDGELHPLQAAFIEHDGFQCGYCTSGQICSGIALLDEARKGDASFVTANLAKIQRVELSPDEIRERMSGNICRCGAYPGIVQAVQSAQKKI